jgi:hypothetical protein
MDTIYSFRVVSTKAGQDHRYLSALQKRQSPLLKFAAAQTS